MVMKLPESESDRLFEVMAQLSDSDIGIASYQYLYFDKHVSKTEWLPVVIMMGTPTQLAPNSIRNKTHATMTATRSSPFFHKTTPVF
jgi:hypothetical protein